VNISDINGIGDIGEI